MKHTLKTLLGGLLLSALPLCADAPASLDKIVRGRVAARVHQALRGRQDRKGDPESVPPDRLEGLSGHPRREEAPYNWVIDTEGRVAIAPEAAHPLGRTYEKGFFRPEDQSQRKPGTRENFGHVSELGGAPGRISGEILYDKASNTWTLNNKSGRYSKHNTDRTPEQLVNAAKYIHEIVDPGTATWGNVAYLLEYAPEPIREELMKSPNLAYDDAKKKSRPHVVVMEAGAPVIRYEKAFEAPKPAETTATKADEKPADKPADAPKKKTKKPKAANNDDPS